MLHPESRTVGLAGCGRWGRAILRDLRLLGSTVVVADPSPVARGEAGAAGAAAVVNRAADLPSVDGVVVATPAATHAAVVDEVLDRGVPLFVEKPLAPDLADVLRLAEAAPDRLFVMHKWRYHPGVEALASVARSGALGAIEGLRTTRTGWGNRHSDVDAVWTLAPHDLSIALEILGRIPAPVTAVAEPAGAGLIGVLGARPWMVLEVSSRGLERHRRVEVHGSRGIAALADPYQASIAVVTHGARSEPHVERQPISTELPLLRELRAYLEHLEGGPPPRSAVDDGVAVDSAVARLRRLAGLDTGSVAR